MGKYKLKLQKYHHFPLNSMAKIKSLTIASPRVNVELKLINSAAESVNVHNYLGEHFGYV